MDIKSRFSKIKQLDKNTSRLVIAVSCIALSLLIVYFGVSLASKGTFSASGYYCSSGTLVENGDLHKCCPSGYTESVMSIPTIGTYCINNNYATSDQRSLQAGVVYCKPTVAEPITGAQLTACTQYGGKPIEYNGSTYCYLACGTAPLNDASVPSCTVVIDQCITAQGKTVVATPKLTITPFNGSRTDPIEFSYSVRFNGAGIGYSDVTRHVTSSATASVTNQQAVSSNLLASGDVGDSISITVTATLTESGATCTSSTTLTVQPCTGDDCDPEPEPETITCWYCNGTSAQTREHTKTANQQTCEAFGDYTNQPTCGGSTQETITCWYCSGASATSSTTLPVSGGATCSAHSTSTRTYYSTAASAATSCSVGDDRCYVTGATAGYRVWVISCDRSADDAANSSCGGSITSDAKGVCSVQYRDENQIYHYDIVKRCALEQTNYHACDLTCYQCENNKTTPQEVVIHGRYYADTCTSKGYAANSSDLTCSKTCYHCVSSSTTAQLDSTKTVADNQTCSAVYGSEYSDTASGLTCSKVCVKCDESNGRVESDPVPLKGDCPPDYKEQSGFTCVQKTCYYCNGTTSASFKAYVEDTSIACSRIALSNDYYDEPQTCGHACYHCVSNSTTAVLDSTKTVSSGQTCSGVYGSEYSDSGNMNCSKTCYKCDSTNGKTADPNPAPKVGNCNDGYKDDSSLTCVQKTCYYCNSNNTSSSTKVWVENTNTNCSTINPNYSNSNNLNCGHACYHCVSNSTTAVLDSTKTVSSGQTCSGVYGSEYSDSASGLTCSKTCYKCDSTNGKTADPNPAPKVGNCNDGYKDESSLTCQQKTCYYCDSKTTASTKVWVENTNTNCSTINPNYSNSNNLDCANACYHCVSNSTTAVLDSTKTVSSDQTCSGVYGSEYSDSGNMNCSKTCYKCDSTNGKTADPNPAPKVGNCNDGYKDDSSLTCQQKTCYYCNDKTAASTKFWVENTSTNCSTFSTSSISYANSKPTCATTCYKCADDSTASVTETVGINKGCSSGYSTSKPSTCAQTCYYCSSGSVEHDDKVPIMMECSTYNTNYTADENLQCDPDVITCYHCVGNEVKPIDISKGETCGEKGYVTESEKDTLTCSEKIKCCACEGNKSVEKSEIDEGEECPEGETLCSEIVCTTPQTGVNAVTIAWILGLAAIGYSFYYFRKTNKQSL